MFRRIWRIRRAAALFAALVLPLSGAAASEAAQRAEGAAARAEGAAAREVAASASDVDDPWLAEDGPAVPRPVEREREQVLHAWRSAPPSAQARAAAVRRVRLELGLGDLVAPSLALLRSAPEAEPHLHAELARALAPDTPAVQMASASLLWEAGERDEALDAFLDAFAAIGSNVDAQLWLVQNLSILLVLVVVGTSLAFMALIALAAFRHGAHDLGDLLSLRMPGFARTAGLVALLLVPLLLGEGVMGLALAFFALGFVYSGARGRSALVLAAILMIIGVHPLGRLASLTSSLLDQDPIARSALAVARGLASPADVERLEEASSDDRLAAHALAFRARRLGLVEESRRRLESIAASHPADPVMLANRANIEMRAGRTEQALDYYERAAALSESPILLFDLSQAYAREFRMEEYESTLARAQALGDEEVGALSRLGDAEMVADLGFPWVLVFDRIRALALSDRSPPGLARWVAPGQLGRRWIASATAFALVALLGLLFADRFDHSSVCARCGHRICTRCEETVWSEDLCDDCHHLFHHPEATDPSLRMARLQALAVREARIGRLALAGSLLIPGMAGVLARRPDLALLGLFLFGWSLAWLWAPSGPVADPLGMGGAASVAFGTLGVLAVVGYLAVVALGLVLRRRL